MSLATREEILGFDDRKSKVISVKAWGGKSVRLMELSYADHSRLSLTISKAQENGGTDPLFMARYVAASIVDEAGVPIFSDSDVEALAAKHRDAIYQIWEEIADLNNMGGTDENVKN